MTSGNLPNVAYEIPTKQGPWGQWHLDEEILCLDLIPDDSPHKNMLYQIDLESINSNSQMLDWIFQLSHKNYYENSVEDLIRAFDAIFDPQNNCCSSGKDKDFSGSYLAAKYVEGLKK